MEARYYRYKFKKTFYYVFVLPLVLSDGKSNNNVKCRYLSERNVKFKSQITHV
jgi:hypothetical protein